MRTAADWAWTRRFPFFPAWRLRGLRLVADDIDWSRGDGLELRGPVESLLLVTTGRPAGLAVLSRWRAGLRTTIVDGLLLGTLMAFAAAWVLKKLVFKGEASMFVMELPPYRMPQWRTVVWRVVERV